MNSPPRFLISPRIQGIVLGLIAIALALGGFQAGRRSVDAAALAKTIGVEPSGTVPDVTPRRQAILEHDQKPITVREIATVPFSELYDVLKSASRDQLLAWARDLERMPRGPRQRAAVTAYYKSLIQVDHYAAIEAVSQCANLGMRDVAIDALLKATPESIWGDVAEMLESLPYKGRGSLHEDLIGNWSRVDPEAVSKFIEGHPEKGEDDSRLYSLLCNWAQINPASAREWLEADRSRQTNDAWRAFVTSWAEADPAAAINYAVANATRPNFQEAVNDLAYQFVGLSKDDATKLMLLLPAEEARTAMKSVAERTSGVLGGFGVPQSYQRPPDEVARWMVNLPVELWSDGIGEVAQEWMKNDVAGATAWLDQMRPQFRDVAIASFCRAARSESAPQVMTLGFTISDPGLRDKALAEFARKGGTTRESAIDYIKYMPLADEQKDYLRKLIAEDANGR